MWAADTKSSSILRGLSKAFKTALGVISWNVTLLYLLSGIFRNFLSDHAMASPSRSGSEQMYISSAASTWSLSFSTTSFLSGEIAKLVLNLLVGSIPVFQ